MRVQVRLRQCAWVATLVIFAVLFQAPAPAQRNLAGAVRTRLALERLAVVGNVLMIGAHPDDENTGPLAYPARGLHVRIAFLAAARGEGGQNLIGSEQGEMLGLIRTQELLAARRIDIFDGIDTTWNRLPGGSAVAKILDEAIRTFQSERPENTIPLPAKARLLITAIPGPQAASKLNELNGPSCLAALRFRSE
jgi:hypothetical protein